MSNLEALSNSNEKDVLLLEQKIRKMYPGYDFLKIEWPNVTKEGEVHRGDPYILEKIYKTSDEICRTRKIYLSYDEQGLGWNIKMSDIYENMVHMASVGIGNCDEKYNGENFFIINSPLTDDIILNLYQAFLDRKKIKKLALLELKNDLKMENIFINSIEAGSVQWMGINSFDFFRKTTDYEVCLGIPGHSTSYVFNVYFVGQEMRIRSIHALHSD